MKNVYIYHAHISEAKTRRLIKCFALDLTSTQTAELTGLNLNTVDRVFNKIRVRILENSQAAFPEQGVVAAGVSHIGSCWCGHNHGQDAAGEGIVFGLFEREGKVYTEIVPRTKTKMLQAIIRDQADIEDAVHAPDWRSYDALIDVGCEKLFRVHHCDSVPSSSRGIHSIERFWGYAKRRLAKFRGIPKFKFELHLKETEFRFNVKGENIYLILLKDLRDNPLNQGNPAP